MGGRIRMTQNTALILRAVAGGHRYGFDIMEACGLPSGTAYPALRRLERAGILRSSWEDDEAAREAGRPRRRLYELTPPGRAELPAAEAKLASALRRLREDPDLLADASPEEA